MRTQHIPALPEFSTPKLYEEESRQYDTHLKELKTFYDIPCNKQISTALLGQKEDGSPLSSPLEYFDQLKNILPFSVETEKRKIDKNNLLQYKIERLKFANDIMRELIAFQKAIQEEHLEPNTPWYTACCETWVCNTLLTQHLLNKEKEERYDSRPLFNKESFVNTIKASTALVKNSCLKNAKALVAATKELNIAIEDRIPPEEGRLYRHFIGMLLFLAGLAAIAAGICLATLLPVLSLPMNVAGPTVGGILMGTGTHQFLAPPPPPSHTENDKKIIKTSIYARHNFFRLAKEYPEQKQESYTFRRLSLMFS